jgi:methylmalonyl-CoA mutase N-terminal domain/subunit
MSRRSESGRPIEAVYGPDALAGFDPETRLGEPGGYPYTRGVYPTMYTGRPWTMRQYAGFGTAKESNERYHRLVEAGTGGLSVAFDLPTQMGYDSDDPIAHGEVGKVGVAIDSLDDVRVLFDGIPLGEVSTSMTINAPAAVLLLLYQLVAEEQGVDAAELTGTVQNDVLKEYVARGTYIYPPPHSLRLASDIFAYCRKEIPRWNTISISGYHMAEAGARRRRRWRSPSPTPRSTSGQRWPRGSASTTSLPDCPSSSSHAPRCWKRSRSSGQPGASGRR